MTLSDDVRNQLDRIEALLLSYRPILRQFIAQQKETNMDLTNLTSAVTNLTTVDESAIALLNQLGDLIRNNVNDPAALQALADSINAESSSLAAAVTANTPAA